MGFTVVIYTDGGCSPNPGKGGWCTILDVSVDGGKALQYVEGKYKPMTTNNEMELSAFWRGLELTKQFVAQHGGKVKLVVDSKYCMRPVTEGWLKKWARQNFIDGTSLRPNAKIWQEVYRLLYTEGLERSIELIWIKGHSESAESRRKHGIMYNGIYDKGNRYADKIAVQCYVRQEDYEYTWSYAKDGSEGVLDI